MAEVQLIELGMIGDTDTGELTPPDWGRLISWIRDRDGLSSRTLGDRIGVEGRQVRRWIAGESDPTPPARRLLLALAREIA